MEDPTGGPSSSSSPSPRRRRRLWRYSAFCRNADEEEITVRAVVRWDLPTERTPASVVAYTSGECLVAVPRRHPGSIYSSHRHVWVTVASCDDNMDGEFRTQEENQTYASSSHRSILARIQVRSSEFHSEREHDHDDDDSLVYINPLLAIHLGCYNAAEMLSNDGDGDPKTVLKLRLIPHTSSDAASRSNAVTLQLVSQRPILAGENAHMGRSSANDRAATRPPLPPIGTVLQSSTLMGITAQHMEYLYEVQIPIIANETEATAVEPGHGTYLVTTRDTHFTVRGATKKNAWPPLLPPPDTTTLHATPAAALFHPNAPDLLRAFWSICQPRSSWRPSPAQCIWHLVGTRYEHDSTHLVEGVAHRLGRSCLVVSGLAAAAVLYADDDDDHPPYAVSTGGWLDKLHGLHCVLRRAMAQAPSVLLVNRLDEEFTPSATRPVDESRLWNLIVESLAVPAEDDASSSAPTSPLARTPPVLVVLVTREALPVGPMQQNLWHPSIPLALPDAAYIEYLWQNDLDSELSFLPVEEENHSKSIPMETVQQLLQGRSAGEILELRREWLASSLEDATAALESLCQQRDDARRHASGRIAPVHWSDVGGLAHVRREIMDAIELPLQYPVLFGSARRSGILLYGPPGTGKTLVAKAVATECGVPFVSVKGPELLGSFVGESEAHVRSTFAQARRWARQNQPSAGILFFDELDSIAPRRGDHAGSGAVIDRVVATLCTELDRGNDVGALVFCMAATNRPDMLDPALLRPGRFDRLVYLGISSTDYQNILVTHLRKLRLCDTPEAMVEVLIPHLPLHLTGADLSTIATGALLRATERLCAEADRELDLLRQQQEEDSNEEKVTLDDVLCSWDEDRLEPVVTLEDLLEAAQSVVPSVNASELENYERIHQQYRQESHSVAS